MSIVFLLNFLDYGIIAQINKNRCAEDGMLINLLQNKNENWNKFIVSFCFLVFFFELAMIQHNNTGLHRTNRESILWLLHYKIFFIVVLKIYNS